MLPIYWNAETGQNTTSHMDSHDIFGLTISFTQRYVHVGVENQFADPWWLDGIPSPYLWIPRHSWFSLGSFDFGSTVCVCVFFFFRTIGGWDWHLHLSCLLAVLPVIVIIFGLRGESSDELVYTYLYIVMKTPIGHCGASFKIKL